LEQYDVDDNDDGLPVLPGYFRMLTIMALYIFQHYQLTNNRKLDCIIFEVGMGGRYDATNCLTYNNNHSNNVVRGITLIDYDHCRVLGNTLVEIAWEKGGIFQVDKGANAPLTPHPQREAAAYELAVQQQQALLSPNDNDNHDKTFPYTSCFALDTNTPQVLQVLKLCAATEGQGARLHVVDTTAAAQQPHPRLPPVLGLPGAHQRCNALLALELCQSLMHPVTAVVPSATDLQRALENVSWPGRCQTVPLVSSSSLSSSCESTIYATTIPTTLRLDGAHTMQSIAAGIEWFRSVAILNHPPTTTDAADRCFRVLLFYCSHERNPVELLQLLLKKCDLGAAYFVLPDSSRPSPVVPATATQLLTEAGIAVQSELLPEQEQQVDSKDDNDNGRRPSSSSSWPLTLASLWKHLERQQHSGESATAAAMDVACNLTVAEALERCTRMGAQQQASRIEVFVTGSLYLVGSALDAIQWEEESAPGGIVI
jgi:folylpolyglutamate synthase/dihydrofolate synthase